MFDLPRDLIDKFGPAIVTPVTAAGANLIKEVSPSPDRYFLGFVASGATINVAVITGNGAAVPTIPVTTTTPLFMSMLTHGLLPTLQYRFTVIAGNTVLVIECLAKRRSSGLLQSFLTQGQIRKSRSRLTPTPTARYFLSQRSYTRG